jgi:hypothetical protein
MTIMFTASIYANNPVAVNFFPMAAFHILAVSRVDVDIMTAVVNTGRGGELFPAP